MEPETILILGAGQAGMQMALSLRVNGFTGEILLIGNETVLPYQRPPLSKAYLKGDFEESSLWLKPPEFYKTHNISLFLGKTVLSIDRETKTIHFEGEIKKKYDILILATGARAFLPEWVREEILPFSSDSILSLRSLAEAKVLREKLKTIESLAIIGAGYIGLEIASIARQAGRSVVLIEREKQVLARTAPQNLAKFLLKAHQEKGVQFYLKSELKKIFLPETFSFREQGQEKASGFTQTSQGYDRSPIIEKPEPLSALSRKEKPVSKGRMHLLLSPQKKLVAVDLVVFGIGAQVNIELASHAGLACDRGILTDETGQTEDPYIYAIGDVAQSPNAYFSGKRCLESIPNALQQAKRTAAILCNKPLPPIQPPWFWSDQYEYKIQSVGIASEASHIWRLPSTEETIQEEFSVKKCVFLHFRYGTLTGCDCINRPDVFMGVKQILARKIRVRKKDLVRNPEDIVKILRSHLHK